MYFFKNLGSLLGIPAFSVCLLYCQMAQAVPMKSSAGIELGGNGTILASDPSLGTFGVGAGYQGSLFFTIWNDRPIGAKIRIERMSFTEEASQKTDTSYLLSGTNLKSMTQVWTFIGTGAEGHFESQGQVLFWEALLGYALGGPSTITVSSSLPDVPVRDTAKTTKSFFGLSSGVGIKREISARITGLMSLRTFFLFTAPYSSAGASNKSFIPIPMMFNIGISVPFDIGKQ